MNNVPHSTTGVTGRGSPSAGAAGRGRWSNLPARTARRMVTLFGGLVVLAACQSPPSGRSASSPAPTVAPQGGASGSAVKSPPGNPQPEPIREIRGRILNRNDQARFVVIELIFSPVPELGRKLSVIRDGAKVGELRTSRWSRGDLVAADIIEGDAQPGDEIKAD